MADLEKDTTVQPATSIEVDGETFTIEQIKEMKLGNLRMQDYTKKTQELASQRKEIESLKETFSKQPEQKQTTPVIDENITKELNEVKSLFFAEKLNRDLERLKGKYTDFDEIKVLTTAQELGITDLEKAYKIVKPEVDVDTLRKQIESDIKKQYGLSLDTDTLATSNGGSMTPEDTVTLTSEENRIRQQFGMSVEEWVNNR